MRLGAYPTDPYYDPERPSWLPYWIDTPTESEAKYAFVYGVKPGQIVDPKTAYPNPPAPAPPAAPQTKEEMTVPGLWTPEKAIAGGWQETLEQYQKFFEQVAAGNDSSSGNSYWLWAAIAVSAVAGFYLLRSN